MSSAQLLLNQAGIHLRSYAPGNYASTCPNCSAKRKAQHQKLQCLGIKIDEKGATWHCNHCDWSGPERGSGCPGNGQDKFEAIYDYHDRDGALRFQKIRNPMGSKKRFWMRRPNGPGAWINNTQDIDTNILYRLPDVIEAIALGHTILVVEGEKDVDNLWRIGTPATCNAHGAHDPSKNQQPKWKPTHSEQLRGADIVVIPDHDDPGYAHCEAACRLSAGVAKRVRRLVLAEHWPDCREGGDISDWLEAGHTREQLDALIAQAPDYEIRSPATDILPLHWHGDVDPRERRRWLIQDLLPEIGSGLLSGQWGTYKTFTAIELAHCIMTVRAFLGLDVVRPGGVLFLVPEGASEIPIRLEGVLKEKGGPQPAPFVWSEVCPPLTDPKAAGIIIKIAETVTARLKQRFNLPLSIIMIDTIIAAAGYRREGADNDTAAAHVVMSTLAQIARGVGCFVLGVDHYGKDASVGTRGSSVKEGDADVILACVVDRSESGNVSNCRLALRKRRSGPNGEEFPFKPRVAEVGINSSGKRETTLVLDWGGVAEPPKTAKNDWGKGKGVKLLRRIIMSMLVDQGIELKPWADGPTVRALKVEQIKVEFFKGHHADGDTAEARKNAKRMAFNRAIEGAADKDVVVIREINGEEYAWLARPSKDGAP